MKSQKPQQDQSASEDTSVIAVHWPRIIIIFGALCVAAAAVMVSLAVARSVTNPAVAPPLSLNVVKNNNNDSMRSGGSTASSCGWESADPSLRYDYHHLIVLVHGYMGSDKELGYLGEALELQAAIATALPDEDSNELTMSTTADTETIETESLPPRSTFTVYAAKTNVGQTTDGIANGGTRLAAEINVLIANVTAAAAKATMNNQHDTPKITLSIVANSLGGLYSRYALSEIHLDKVQPRNTNHTYVKVPRRVESFVGDRVMGATGRDLFHISTLVPDMATQARFLEPLGRFAKRIALANAYGTDFLVPVATAAFVSATDTVAHTKIMYHNDTNNEHKTNDTSLRIRHSVLEVVTQPQPGFNSSSLTDSLNALGWTKIFMDVRTFLPAMLQFKVPVLPDDQAHFTGAELHQQFSRLKTLTPFGHPLLVANARSEGYRKVTARGRPIMDDLAARVVSHIRALVEEDKKKDESGGGDIAGEGEGDCAAETVV